MLKVSMSIFISFTILVGLFGGCSELKEPISTNQPAKIQVHPKGFLAATDPDFHGKQIQGLKWDISGCADCHGADFNGGVAELSCNSCHVDLATNCTLCHGNNSNPSGSPPSDLLGNTETVNRGVGLHQLHLTSVKADTIECATCHIVPNSMFDNGHIDNSDYAEVRFDNQAVVDSANPLWSSESLKCSNTYCHGNWSLAKSASSNSGFYTEDAMTGKSATVGWTDAPSGSCDACHGLPPKGHSASAIEQCGGCHSNIVDAAGNIVDANKHLHINGQINLFGLEYPMF